ncbi:MAG TPA: site-specific integrase [Candidatus Nanoarchaeia archaeon]|nr:site-specific integrase [Candidatus Nanoarchaeia archaeon]
MTNVKVFIHNRNLDKRKEGIKEWKISSEDKKDLIKFLDDLGLGKVNKGTKISEQRQLKYLDLLKIPLTFFNKPTSKLTLKDIESFEKALSSDKLKTFKGTGYNHNTKVDIRRVIKIYLKWKLGDTEKFRKMTDWFDMGQIKKTPDYLSEEEITQLYKGCKNNSERFLIAVLFDVGCRAEEFHNIRYEDIQLPTKDENFVKITLKEEYSKTTGRVVSLFWKNSLEAVKDFIKERERDGVKSNEPIFNNNYDNTSQFIKRLGKKILNKSIHYHLFRHSSATYYASKLNRQQLCYRYGWRFSSTMPDIYISRSGMENKELDEKFTNTKIEDLKLELEKEKQQKNIEFEEMKKQMADIENNFEEKFNKMVSAGIRKIVKSNSLPIVPMKISPIRKK